MVTVVMSFMTVMRVVMRMRISMLMLASGSTAVVTFLSYTFQVMLLITFTFVWRAVAFTTRVVTTDTPRVFS